VWLLEDGLAESDWTVGFAHGALGDRIEIVGDDIFCTNPAIITDAIVRKVANASLIKVNQIGSVTETLDAMRICRDAGYAQFVSHRSGETEDAFIADWRRHGLRPYEDWRAAVASAWRSTTVSSRSKLESLCLTASVSSCSARWQAAARRLSIDLSPGPPAD